MTYKKEINRIIRDAINQNDGRLQQFVQLTDNDGNVVDYLGRRSDEIDGFGDSGHGIILVNAGAKLLEREKTTRGFADLYSFSWSGADVDKLAAALWEECSCYPMKLDDDADGDEIRYFADKLRLEEEFETDLEPQYGGPKLESPCVEGYDVITHDKGVIINRLNSASYGCSYNAVNLKIRLVRKSGYKSKWYKERGAYPDARFDTSDAWEKYEEIELTTRFNDCETGDENENQAYEFLVNSEWYELKTVEEIAVED